MERRIPTLKDIQAAAQTLSPYIIPTPLLSSFLLDSFVGTRVWVKAESLQKTGSFKFRGVVNRLSKIPEEGRSCGVIAFSSGNHGYSVAVGAFLLGLHATLLIPEDAPKIKVRHTSLWGANIVRYDRYRDDREAMGMALQKRSGGTLVKPFDDLDIITGHATLGLELVQQAQEQGIDLDIVLVPCSGGGLVSGIALALSYVSPHTRVYGVEPEGFTDTKRSLDLGYRVSCDVGGRRSICDALLVDTPGEITFTLNQRFLYDCLAVGDEEVLRAMKALFEYLKIVSEPSGCVGLAAVLSQCLDVQGKNVVIVCSGGNVDSDVFAQCLGK